MPHTDTQVHIEGAHERYIQRGSILAITCTVDHPGRTGPRQVAWYQGAARLHYDSPRGGIALQVCAAVCLLHGCLSCTASSKLLEPSVMLKSIPLIRMKT